jgi:hypothetical protein
MQHSYDGWNDVTDVTICLWMKINFLRGQFSHLVTIADTNGNENLRIGLFLENGNIELLQLKACRKSLTTEMCVGHFMFQEDQNIFHQWNHLCFCNQIIADIFQLSLVINGNVADTSKIIISKDNIVHHFNMFSFSETWLINLFFPAQGTIMLGQRQTLSNLETSFSGYLSQFLIWDRKLELPEISSIASCHDEFKTPSNPILKWNANTWKRSKVSVLQAVLNSFCQHIQLADNFIFGLKVKQAEVADMCTKVNGKMGRVEQIVDLNSKLVNFLTEINDPILEDNCRVNADKVKFWLENDKPDNCSYLFGPRHEHLNCDLTFPCGHCDLPKNNFLMLKGLCNEEDSPFDQQYYVYSTISGRPYFRGIMKSHIFFQSKTQRWLLQSLISPKHRLESLKINTKSLPFGTFLWRGLNEEGWCGEEQFQGYELTLSNCFPNKYTCDSGHCIDLRYAYWPYVIYKSLKNRRCPKSQQVQSVECRT